MARTINRLKASQVKSLGVGMHHDGGGLYLQVVKTGGRSWLFRYMLNGKSREMGLGSVMNVSLSEARELALEYRRQKADGIDPIQLRNRERQKRREEALGTITFAEAVAGFLQVRESEWKNPKHAMQWSNTLNNYAVPVIGEMDVADVTLPDVLRVLEPIWKEKTETASRVRGRIEKVLDWARVRGYRSGDNPARWKGNLDTQLPSPAKLKNETHHKALSWRDLGDFMVQLRTHSALSAKALEVLILTATRSEEIRGAQWSEFDFDQRIWTIPADRMKANREHRIPLCARAVEILTELSEVSEGDSVFVGNNGKKLSENAMRALLKRMGRVEEATAHGFRSTFRDWAAETTGYPGDVVEMALAHSIRNKVEAAYRRGDLFEKRRLLMNAWEKFCNTPSNTSDESGKIIPIRNA